MTPLMMRIFTLVGIALAAASMQSKARADTLSQPVAEVSPASAAMLAVAAGMRQP